MALTTDDLVHINALYARYNSGIDTGDGAAFAGCFTSDGHLDTGMGPSEGTEAIAAFAEGTHEMMPGLRHQANNIVVDGGPDTATGSAFFVGYQVDDGYKVIITGRYNDELERTADGWRFARRIFTAD